MLITSWNVNGIRSVFQKNFLQSVKKIKPDIICLQEIKAQETQIPEEIIKMGKYYSYFNYAVKKGYAGVAVFTKQKPLTIKTKFGLKRFDQEGRFLQLEFNDFILINLYLPHGGRQKENLEYKLVCYKHLLNYLKKIKNKKIILTGDFNIAHQEIDLARPKQNKNNVMFTLSERKQLTEIIKLGFFDTFRNFNQAAGQYTWWPYFANARERNLGWRIDYIFVSKKLLPKLKQAFIFSKTKGSDHCPVGIKI